MCKDLPGHKAAAVFALLSSVRILWRRALLVGCVVHLALSVSLRRQKAKCDCAERIEIDDWDLPAAVAEGTGHRAAGVEEDRKAGLEVGCRSSHQLRLEEGRTCWRGRLDGMGRR
jgi:hypothetical protein